MAKKGEHQTCPNCGASLIGGLAKCPECGYTISNIAANSSAILLDKRLQRSSRWDRANIIRSFPIPNTRDDLMEFLSALEPKALVRPQGEDDDKKETKAYYEKFVECLNKARISFGNDSATKMFEANLARFKKKQHLIICLIVVLVVIITGGIIWGIVYGVSKEREDIALKANLQDEYDTWVASVTPEMEVYSDSLSKELDKIPVPTASNWEKCGHMLNKVTWSKKWPVPSKFKELIFWEGPKNPNYSYKNNFVDKKNSIGKTIQKAHKQALMNNGMSEHDASWATADEFYEVVSMYDY